MFQVKTQEIKEGKVIQYQIYQGEALLSFEEVIEAWQANRDFRKFFNQQLAAVSYDAFFWETPSMSASTLAKPFEFVLVKSKILVHIQTDGRDFEHYFQTAEQVVHFPNLSGDAHLVAPCPVVEKEAYAHLACFVRKAPEAQIQAFWQKVGEVYAQNLGEEKRWLSTSGLGVHWLHVRIDSFPKYYQYKPYRT